MEPIPIDERDPCAQQGEPDFDSLKCLLLDLAQERSLCVVLKLITARLAQIPAVALARLWLIREGDICAECPRAGECEDRARCLHLVASAGTPRETGADWSRTDGDFRRFPLGARKVGTIASTGEPLLIQREPGDAEWVACPRWAEEEGVVSFAGQPLLFKGEVLGVLAVFMREPAAPSSLTWLRLVADHAGAAIAQSRAFAEIERLKERLELENTYLREEVASARAFGDIVGESTALELVLHQIELVAPTDASVLILGESGTGKELVARAIHDRSGRADAPLIRVNCAAIPRELYESEFFGHVRGAFTGALRDRAGRFEAADGGTLFLDEVGEIPLELQSKLLRVLQEGQFERVGDEATRKVDVRIIAATNRDLKADVEAGHFRQDLYFRLNVFPIEVAPLRARPEDIGLLATHFLEKVAKRLGRDGLRLTQANVLELQRYDWPGNVRELQNVIERAAIISQPGRGLRLDMPAADGAAAPVAATTAAPENGEVVSDDEMQRRVRANVLAALEQSDWRVYGKDGAAERLGLKPTTLASRMKKMGLRRKA